MHRSRRLSGLLAALLTATVVGTATPAQAALPDKVGFVLFNGAVVASGTQPASTTVTVVPPGYMEVRFPGLAAPGGVVHVTAVNDAPRWCQAWRWWPSGPDEVADIVCYSTGGTLVPTGFSAIFESNSGPAGPINGRFGYIQVDPAGATVTQYNSKGAVNHAIPHIPGVTEVKLPALATSGPLDGSLQVTAVRDRPARCKVLTWTSSSSEQDVIVGCFDAAGAPFSAGFTLTYQFAQSLYGAGWPPKYFGYLYNKPLGGPPSTNFNSALGTGTNAVSLISTGLYQVGFPKLAWLPDNVQVTAAGSGSDYCNLITAWAHSGSDTIPRVACYTNAGARVTAGFTISDNSAF